MVKIFSINPYIKTHTFYKLRNKFRKFVGKNPSGDFKLLSKIDNIEIKNFNQNNNDYPVNKSTVSYSYVKVGKCSDKNFSREIITFYDKSGKILQRDFWQNGKRLKRKIYGFNYLIKCCETQIFTNKWERYSREFFTKTYDKKDYSKTYNFKKEIDFFTENAKEFLFTKISKVGKNKIKKNGFRAKLMKDCDNLKVKDYAQFGHLDIDLDDEFLPFRFLNPKDSDFSILLTKKLLEDLNLQDLNIEIKSQAKDLKNKYASASFSAQDNMIRYSPYMVYSVQALVKTIAHEVRHAFQWSQTGRVGMKNTDYQKRALQLFGPIKDNSELYLANKYVSAIEKYPILDENSTLKEVSYKQNFLELDANDFAEQISSKYVNNRNYTFFQHFNFDLNDWLEVRNELAILSFGDFMK